MLEPGVFIATETKYYDVSGSTEYELNAQTASLGPDGFMARTDPFYRWNYIFRAQDGSCRIDRVRVDTLITFTYPRWNDPKEDLKLAEWWGRSLASLEDHEGGHAGTAKLASQEIYDALNQLPPTRPVMS
jgi:predicted secreted Zn-dependent protease